MRLLITGHDGFVGRYLCASSGGTGLTSRDGDKVDIRDPSMVKAALDGEPPDAVIHLAAQTFVPDAFRDPHDTYDVNFMGTLNLLEGLKWQGFKGRFLLVSTADVYGTLDQAELPARETTPPCPLNPYSVSKVAAETLCGYAARVDGLDLVIARPFNHIGPGQSTRFSIADFSKTIAEIKLGMRDHSLQVGDLDVTRDFTDVRDVVNAYLRLLEHGRSGEIYNVCSGIERHLGTAVQQLATLAGVAVEVKVDPERLRKSGQRRACGSNEKLILDTAWHPGIDWLTSLRDMLGYWEQELQ